MDSFERFKNRNRKRMDAQDNINTSFIFKGYPTLFLENTTKKNNKTVTTVVRASVVSQQEKDKAYIYTLLPDVLACGSVWSGKSLHWLIAEEIITIKDVKWHKYLAYLCNIEVEDTWGYFKGPEKNYVNIKNEQGASLESLQKPVLVLPENILGFEDKIVINQRPWLVQEWDAISSPGIVYYSLRATTISKEVAAEHKDEKVYIERVVKNITDIAEEPEEQETNIFKINNEIDITLPTENGYFIYNNNQIRIAKRTATEVVFSLPFGVNEVEVETKEGGAVVTRKYVTN